MGCPLYGKSTGFCLGSGNPKTAKIGLLLEAPGRDEVIWRVEDGNEISRRRERFPEMEEKFLKIGMPVVGKSGGLLFSWMLGAAGLHRGELFIDNVLRCLPPKEGESQYPKGDIRKSAESHCRQYDRWDEFSPTIAIINIHPAAIAREVSPLPMAIQTFQKAKDFHLTGERPVVLCGGKAAKWWMGYGETVATWLGHFQIESDLTRGMREKRREVGMGIKEPGIKKAKVKKLNLRSALEYLIEGAIPYQAGDYGDVVGYETVPKKLTEEQFKQVMGLLVKKERKNGK